MLKSKTRWKINETIHHEVGNLAKQLNIAPLVASLLINRGMNTPELAEAFLNIDRQDFHDPFLMDEMDVAVDRINKAIESKEKILIFGDYDADGVSSTTVLLTALLEKGALAEFYIPNRFTEGYGPNEGAFRWAKEQGFSLIITVDTGISAISEAKFAKEIDIDLIITDHHEPGPELPPAVAIIHPKKPACQYPFKDLAGVGVAFKLAHAILGYCPESLLDVCAIGTIADLVPLHGENRLIASRGIKRLRVSSRPGIKALLKLCGTPQNEVNEETIGFAIAPRINAVGRLDSADPAVYLLMTEDLEEAETLAEEIDRYNKERQQLVNKMTEEAINIVEENYPPDENSVLVIAKKDWNAGVIGIVASRLVDRFYRPTIVLSLDEAQGTAKGSARSIEGFNLYENLYECREILPHFGGHPMAAGMTLRIEHVDELRARLNKKAKETLTLEDFIPVTNVDVVCSLEEVSIDSIYQLESLAPFGMSNPKPRVLIKDTSISSIRKIGTSQNHLKVVFERNGCTLDGVGFGFGEKYDEISPISKVNMIGELSINEWNNFRKPQIMLHDLEVKEWQLFDIRGTKTLKDAIVRVSPQKRKLIAFSEETIPKLTIEEYRNEVIICSTNEDACNISLNSNYVFLLDLPSEIEILETLFTASFPDRIYPFFYNDESHYFSTIPTREHFKWFYGFLAKKSPFDLNRHAKELASYRGWSKETVHFMSQVFFELEFVKIENGFISLSNSVVKKDLSESKTYQLKQQQIELENKLLYSSYQQLKSLFDQLNKGSLMNEEALI